MAMHLRPRYRAPGNAFPDHTNPSHIPTVADTNVPCAASRTHPSVLAANRRLRGDDGSSMMSTNFGSTAVSGLASAGLYAIGNYAVHKATKPAKSDKADPTAIKAIGSGGKILKQGIMQGGSSIVSSYGYNSMVRSKISPDWWPKADVLVPSASTGVLKTVAGYVFGNRPSMGAVGVDFLVSAVSDGIVRYMRAPLIDPNTK